MRTNRHLSGVLPQGVKLSTSRIIKGTPEQSFSSVCALTNTRDLSGVFCTGTLIAPRVVLTAAHCVVSAALRGMYFSVLFVKEGSQTDVLNFEVDRVYVPKCYMNNKRSSSGVKEASFLREFDVAVIVLKENVPLDLAVPYTLDTRALAANTLVKIVGFGLDKTESDVLQQLRSETSDFDTLSAQQKNALITQKLRSLEGSIKRSANIRCTTKGTVQICEPNSDEQIQYRGDSGGPILRIVGSDVLLCGVNGYVSTEESATDSTLFSVVKCVANSILSSMFFIESCFKKEGFFGDASYKITSLPKTVDEFKNVSLSSARLYLRNATIEDIAPELVVSKRSAVVVSDEGNESETSQSEVSVNKNTEGRISNSTNKMMILSVGLLSVAVVSLVYVKRRHL